MDQITPESSVAQDVIPPLDKSLLELSEDQLRFLHATLSGEDDELRMRILEVQKEAYAQYPYPCIRAFHHVSLMASANPAYQGVLEAGKTGTTTFLDIGCCMGTDVRKLAFDGYPASGILGCDLRQEFIDLGYKLYDDRDSCAIRFFTSDIFSVVRTSQLGPAALPDLDLAHVHELGQLQGHITHVYTGALFHLFDEQTQHALARRVASLLRRTRGALIFGRHSGLDRAGMIDDHLGRTRYGHSVDSWPGLWKAVFAELEGEHFAERVVVDVRRDEHSYAISRGRGQSMLVWSVRIV